MNSSTDFERWFEISMPTSLIARIASGRTKLAFVASNQYRER
jgi:hypothetical protein